MKFCYSQLKVLVPLINSLVSVLIVSKCMLFWPNDWNDKAKCCAYKLKVETLKNRANGSS